MTSTSIRARLACVLVCLFTLPGAALAQTDYPNKPVRIIVPFTPGGGNDVLARIIGAKLTERWSQPVIVENKPGAGGNIGVEFAARAAPDGYTWVIGANQLAMVPWLYPKLPFDVVKDLQPLSLVATTPMVVAVHTGLPIRTVKELIDYTRANSGKLAYGTPGNGSPHHLATEMFLGSTGLTMIHVPYKGAAPIWAALISGEIGVHFGALNSASALAQAGKIRLIAAGTAKRIASMPDLPTVAESGVPDYEAVIWYALFASGGTPEDIANRIHAEIVRVLEQPDVRNRLNGQGFEVGTLPPQALGALLRRDLERWGKVIRTANIKIQ